MKSAIKELEEKAKAAKAASKKLAFLSTEIKNKALLNIKKIYAKIQRKEVSWMARQGNLKVSYNLALEGREKPSGASEDTKESAGSG